MTPDDFRPPLSPSSEPQPDLFDAHESDVRASSVHGHRHALPAAQDVEHARAIYAALRAHLARAVVGHERARDRLALVGTRHALGHAGTLARAVLVGPSGCGKTTLVRTLAEALGCPYALVDATEIAETNWSGLQIADVLGDLWTQAKGSLDRMARAVIVLDEIDKLAMRGTSGASRDYQLGRQRSLLPLLGGGTIHFPSPKARDQKLTWNSTGALIVGAGVFAGLPRGRTLVAADIQRLGFEHEFVERLGHVIRLDPLGPADLQRVLRDGLRDAIASYAAFGIALTISDEVCGLVARAVTDGRLEAGPRQAVTMLAYAAQVRLLELLESGAPTGTAVTLSPDDLDLPTVLARRRGR